jgi:hypothetical protein
MRIRKEGHNIILELNVYYLALIYTCLKSIIIPANQPGIQNTLHQILENMKPFVPEDAQ